MFFLIVLVNLKVLLVAYKLLHSLKNRKKGNLSQCALKLDMSKAYDRVEWDFLANMMHALGFHAEWTKLVMKCITFVKYAVVVNGSVTDSFIPE